MLEKLLDKFISERTALEKEEMNTKHNFDMLIQDLTAQKGQALAMLRFDTSSHIVQAKAAQYLRDRASQLNGRVLSALAVRVAADPFGK
eukprot:8440046-Heterocapsa_arctica.AAC.1